MEETPNVSLLAEVLSDNSRYLILDLLMDGKFHTVKELANAAGIEHNTASYHLKKLNEFGWLNVERHGRFKYHQLANLEIANLFELLTNFSPSKKIQSLRRNIDQEKLLYCRICYDHLAGSVGVKITKWLIENEMLLKNNEEWNLTGKGEVFFSEKLQLCISDLKKEKRVFCRMCLDWSERQHHLAGTLGKYLSKYFVDNGYIIHKKDSRAVSLTSKGKEYFEKEWNLYFDEKKTEFSNF